jgi:predicted DNA-binding protein (MmcQ/YjbR family)
MATEDQLLRRLRRICLSLPETSETSSWGHPNFRAGKRTFVAFEWIDGRPSIAFKLDPMDVELLLQPGSPPRGLRAVGWKRKAFFATPYGRGQWISLWADRTVNWRLVEDLAHRSYRLAANKRMMAALNQMDQNSGPR